MAQNAEPLVALASRLNEKSCTEATDAIAASFDHFPGEAFDAQRHRAIIERRMHELRSGRVQAVTLDELRAE